MGYKDLITYKQTEEIYDLTVKFCDCYISKFSRTHDQMVQAARSAKQNIAEGSSQGTSLKFYIKEIGISRGSLEELLEDYLDFARQKGIMVWERGDERVEKVKRGTKVERMSFFFPSLPSSPSSPSLPSISNNPSSPSNLLPLLINYLIDLLKRTNYLLDQQKKGLEKKFVEEGGYTENLFKKRLNNRKSSFKILFPFFLFFTLFSFLPSKTAKAANINFSLEAWVKPASSIATKAILVKNNEMRLVTDASGNPSCQIYSDSWQTAAVSSSALSLGAWQNVICTYDGSNIKVYIDGVLKDTEEETADVNDTANGMQVGNDAGATYGKFEGQIDSVRIFSRALSANEIKAHYDLGNLAHDGGMEDGDAGEWAQASEGSELLSNTGFETAGAGDPDFWANWTENAGDGALVNETVNKRSGDDAMKATAGASADAYAKQAVAVTAGKTYKATFWTRGDGTYSGRYAIYDATNLADIVATTTASVTGTTYTKITKYFTAPATCSSVELYLYCPSTNTGIAYFDDVSIVSAQTASAESGTVADEDGLVGGWNFEDNATDISGNGNNGTLYGDAAYSSSGRFGKALTLDGNGDYVDMGNGSSLNITEAITLEVWVKPIEYNDSDVLIMRFNPRTYYWRFDTSKLKFRVWGYDASESSIASTNSLISTNVWYHVVATYDKNYLKTYVNGVLDGTPISFTKSLASNSSHILIDEDPEVAGRNFSSLIDSVRIYNRALSASEIAARYSLGRGKFDNYAAKIKLAADDSNSYLDESLTNGSDYLLSYWYKMGEDNINPINFTISGAGTIDAEQNLMSTSASGLVGAWNFEEGGSSVTTADLSGNGNTGTVTNAGGGTNATIAAMWTDGISGKYGRSLEFDGTDDYVDLGITRGSVNGGTGDASFEAWSYFTGEVGVSYSPIFGSLSNGEAGTNFFVGKDASNSNFGIEDGGWTPNMGLTISQNTWQHVVYVRKSNVKYLYVNGVVSATTAAAGTPYSNNKITIGYENESGGFRFAGKIDSPRIYNRALTASEVYDSYKAGNWRQYELSFEADAGDGSGNTLFKFIQNGTTSGNSIVYADNFRVDKNLVDKGGFESFIGGDPNIPTGWSNSGLDGTEGVEGSDGYHTGAKSMKFVSADADEGITQTVTVESGKYYTFSIWAKNSNQNLNAVLSGGVSATIDLTTANNNWAKFSGTYKPSSTSFTISILSGDTDQTGYFDDISLIELDSYTGATTATTTTPSTATNSYGAGRWGESSGALLVDGADTLTYPTANNIYADEGTVAFWVKPALSYNKYGENKYLWTLDDGTNHVARIYYNYSDYKFYFEVYDGSSWTTVQAVSSAQSFTRNTWIHIAANWNDRKNQAYLYVNGANDGSDTDYWYAQTLPTNMYFGSDYDGTNTGEMYFDDLRIYDHALTTEDIKRLYGSASDPSASTLRVEIPFTSGGAGINGTGLYSLTGSFTAAFGYHTTKPTTEYGLGIFGSDNLQYGRGTQVDGIVYESFDGYQGTIKTWVKPSFDGTDATTNVILQNGDGSNYIKLYYSSGNLYFDAYTSSTTYRAYKSVSDWTAGTWYHIAAVWSNESFVTNSATGYLMDLYVNGSNSSVTHSGDTFGTNFWTAFAPSATTFVGEDKDAANQFNGVIGGLTIDNRPWSGDTILTDYNSGSGTSSAVSSETRLVLLGPNESTRSTNMVYWPIIESTGNLITDGNMEDGDVAEWSESANAYSSVESGIIAPEDGLVGGWNYESNLTDASGNSKNGVSHTNPSCPTGYVFVPGNSTFSTSDFCVMKYEAKYDSNVDGTGDDAPTECKYNTSYDTWDWGKDVATGCGYNVNEPARVVSTAAGSPIAGITHTQALTACPVGDHIVTNDEWMTIARDAEQVNANWTNGAVGSGCLFAGNNGDATCGYNGSDPEKGTGRNARAKFILSSGEEIYDISGNVWEHVKVDASDTLIDNHPTDGGAAGWRWIEFTAITGYGDLSYNQIRPSDASWNATQGMGRLYTYNGVSYNRVFLRGGTWNDGASAGAFTLNLSWNSATHQGSNVGFRCSR